MPGNNNPKSDTTFKVANCFVDLFIYNDLSIQPSIICLHSNLNPIEFGHVGF